jgi:hypothetical protein
LVLADLYLPIHVISMMYLYYFPVDELNPIAVYNHKPNRGAEATAGGFFILYVLNPQLIPDHFPLPLFSQ